MELFRAAWTIASTRVKTINLLSIRQISEAVHAQAECRVTSICTCVVADHFGEVFRPGRKSVRSFAEVTIFHAISRAPLVEGGCCVDVVEARSSIRGPPPRHTKDKGANSQRHHLQVSRHVRHVATSISTITTLDEAGKFFAIYPGVRALTSKILLKLNGGFFLSSLMHLRAVGQHDSICFSWMKYPQNKRFVCCFINYIFFLIVHNRFYSCAYCFVCVLRTFRTVFYDFYRVYRSVSYVY